MTNTVKLTATERFQFYYDNQNKSDEWILSKLPIKERTLFRYKAKAKVLSEDKENARISDRNSENESEEEVIDYTNVKITKELVEFWILDEDERADLGMKFLQYKDKFSKEVNDVDEDEEEEFRGMLNRDPLEVTNNVDNNSPDSDEDLFSN